MAHVAVHQPVLAAAGNPGYDATIDRIHARLRRRRDSADATDRGRDEPRRATSSTWIEEYPNAGQGLGLLGRHARDRARPAQPDEIVLSREQRTLALCINSFSTPPGGVTAPLVDVGRGDRDEDYAGKDVKGAVVIGDADAGAAVAPRVIAHGAIGVISTRLGEYVNPDPPGAPRDAARRVEHSAVGQHPVRRGAQGLRRSRPHRTPRARAAQGARARPATRHGARDHREHVLDQARRARSSPRFPAASRRTSAIVIAAHVQEPGANDNASGVATLAELARALRLGDPRGHDSAAGAHDHVPLARGDQRQPPVAEGSRRRGEERAVHVLDGHDRRGRRGRPAAVPDRALARSRRRVGAAVGSAHRVGPRQRARRIAQGRPAQRSAPRDLRARRARRPAGS